MEILQGTFFLGWWIVIPEETIYLQKWMENIKNDNYLWKYFWKTILCPKCFKIKKKIVHI